MARIISVNNDGTVIVLDDYNNKIVKKKDKIGFDPRLHQEVIVENGYSDIHVRPYVEQDKQTMNETKVTKKENDKFPVLFLIISFIMGLTPYSIFIYPFIIGYYVFRIKKNKGNKYRNKVKLWISIGTIGMFFFMVFFVI